MHPNTDHHAQLGYPPSGHLRFVKRLIGRLIWPFLHHQIAVNSELIDEIRRIDNALDVLTSELPARIAQSIEFASLATVVAGYQEPIQRFENAFAETNQTIGRIQLEISTIQEAISATQEALEQVHGRVASAYERIDLSQRQSFARYHEGAGSLQRDLAAISQQFYELEQFVRETKKEDSLRSEYESLTAELKRNTGAHFETVRSLLGRRIDALRDAVNDQTIRLAHIDLLLNDHKDENVAEVEAAPWKRGGIVAAAASAFSSSRADAAHRAHSYFDVFLDVAPVGPVLDLGSERGAWLEALHELGIEAYGLAGTPDQLESRRALGLDIRDESPIAHLRSLAPSSLGGIVASGLPEQLGLESLIELIELAVVALHPGGWLVFEAFNGNNLAVASSGAYRNPLTRRPLPPELLEFLVAAGGLIDTQIRYQNDTNRTPLRVPDPESAPWAPDIAPAIELLNRDLLGPSHYAVIARRR